MTKIQLSKQSYLEAREAGLIREGKLVGLIFGCSSDSSVLSESAIHEINDRMSAQAIRLGATAIFGIEYQGVAGGDKWGTMGHGDAYKVEDATE